MQAGYAGSGKGSGLARGVLLGVGAGLLWGLVFVAPQLLPSFTALEVALGRYLFYGVVSAGMLLVLGKGSAFWGHGREVWLTALAFAFTGNAGYYLLVILGVRLAGAPVTTLIIGTLPVTVAVVGNLIAREFPFRRLAAPVSLILFGLLVINLLGANGAGQEGAGTGGAGGERILGLICTFAALALWTAYGVANARFLKAHPDMSGSTWSTMVGVATLVWVALAVPLGAVVSSSIAPGAVDFGKLADLDASLAWFIAASAFLGLVVSWGGTLLWNGASTVLPTALAGQLIVSETLSGLFYVFLADARVPSPAELVGIITVVTGVLLGVRRTKTPERTPEQIDSGKPEAAVISAHGVR